MCGEPLWKTIHLKENVWPIVDVIVGRVLEREAET